jgi:hypothetical protein
MLQQLLKKGQIGIKPGLERNDVIPYSLSYLRMQVSPQNPSLYAVLINAVCKVILRKIKVLFTLTGS